MRRAHLAGVAALACASCGPPYVARPGVLPEGTVFEEATGPLSYQASTPRDVGRVAPRGEAHGEACQYGIIVPISAASTFFRNPTADDVARIPPLGVVWGEGGYAAAMADAQQSAGGGRLYDVRADLHISSVLGVYVRDCVDVHASIAP